MALTSNVPTPAECSAGIRIPELLAPAGDWDCARAAVENGADAIYFGLSQFNARMRARNFTEADLPELMEFLHRRGVKGYVTLNTLIFTGELLQAQAYLRAIIRAGADAVIVQDVGLCRLIRRMSPDFPIHASTQMTISSGRGVAFARELGCNLVVLARECSIREIEAIRGDSRQTQAGSTGAASSEMELPLEVFVHGALCVAYSGQCLTSEALGGRSANRGECAQACRMPYELISDGQLVPLGDRRYLLSPQDLAGLEVLPELVRAGVVSLKIEGRLKTPEYVANITRIYRQALGRLLTGQLSKPDAPATSRMSRISSALREPETVAGADRALSQDRYDMEMAFSRGLHTGWLEGIDNQRLVHGRFGKKRGVYLGQVSRIQGPRVWVRLEAPLKPGDGIVFDAGHPDQPEEGGRVYAFTPEHGRSGLPRKAASLGSEVALEFGRDAIRFDRVHPGDRVWKTSDPELDKRLRQTFEGRQPHCRRCVDMEVWGELSQRLTLEVRDDQGHVIREQSEVALEKARSTPLTTKRLEDHLGRLGGTPFKLGALVNRVASDAMLPVSELNRLRRQAVSVLESLRAQPRRWTLHEIGDPLAPIASLRDETPLRDPSQLPAAAAELIVLVRTLPQAEAALRSEVQTLYCEFENPKRYREAVRLVRESARGEHRPEVFVAPPRISKPGEDWILKQVTSSEPDGILARNYDHLEVFSGSRCIGDFSLNVANPLTAQYLLERYRLERLTASYDLNIQQLEDLLRACPPRWFEITIHQHMPLFHMEHCVFCAFLSRGTDHTNCGRPCDHHEVRLRDRVGAEHTLKADAGCRNTLFSARAQTGAEYVGSLQALGARVFRIEFLSETADEVERTIDGYRALLRGELTGAALWRELKVHHQLGVTRGPMERA